jgi:hypothetical protein
MGILLYLFHAASWIRCPKQQKKVSGTSSIIDVVLMMEYEKGS